jgi:hypothetical protein
VKLGPATSGRVITGLERSGVKVPPRGTAIAVPPPPVNEPMSASPAMFAFKQSDCELCKELGKEMMHSHVTEDCWANPYSAKYRKGTYE